MIRYVIPLLSLFLESGIMDFMYVVWGLGTLITIIGLIKDLITWGKS